MQLLTIAENQWHHSHIIACYQERHETVTLLCLLVCERMWGHSCGSTFEMLLYQCMFTCEGNSRPKGLHPLANCCVQPPCDLLKKRAQLNGCDNGIDWSSFSHSWSLGFLNICRQTLHHLYCSAHSEGKRWEEARKIVHIVAFAPVLCSDLPLCFQFHIHIPDSSLGNHPFLYFSPHPLYSASLSIFFSPSHLSPSCSQSFFFQFWNTLNPEEATWCPPPVRNVTPCPSLSCLCFSLLCHKFTKTLTMLNLVPHISLLSFFFFFFRLLCSYLKNRFLDGVKKVFCNLLFSAWPLLFLLLKTVSKQAQSSNMIQMEYGINNKDSLIKEKLTNPSPISVWSCTLFCSVYNLFHQLSCFLSDLPETAPNELFWIFIICVWVQFSIKVRNDILMVL